ncbi:MAG: hypothetical protein JOY62_15890 [Acidobacteriaceae bacterium]|nr:hypothetical protein [Acidobacteriaceae bacterium]
MTRLSRIFFRSASFALGVMLGGTAWSAMVSGNIDVTRTPEATRGGEQSNSDIVVWLTPIHPNSAFTSQPQHAQLLQKDKMFHPHTLVITAGTTVDFPNADPIFHNAFSTFDGQIFDVGLYPPGTSRSVRFRKSGIVRVFCNIHPSMFAIIVVVDTPYFTKAGRDGRYRLMNVPPGEYELHVFDERATQEPTSQMLVSVDETQSVVTPSPIHLSEAGYVQLPHKNKYGLDYPPSSETDTYIGPPK